MNWTFGIITDGSQDDQLNQMYESIVSQKIPLSNWEIIIVGNSKLQKKNLSVLKFDENIKQNWITKKKNILVQNSQFENIVLMHDYLLLEPDWYTEFEKFGDNWDVCMNRLINPSGERYRDWVSWAPIRYIPYENNTHLRHMYVSGAYFCVKKTFYLENPLDESIVWGMGEDVEWSLRIRDKWNYRCNHNSIVKLINYKEPKCHPYDANDIGSKCLQEHPFQIL
jgi:hypothetical protein